MASPDTIGDELIRLAAVMARLRRECPWDGKQTHRSLVPYLVEEAGEVVDAIEAGSDDDLREELGDLLLQVYFHAAIADEAGRFDIDDVAASIADKLVRRHPHVFAGESVPDDMRATWEASKRAEKGRRSSLDGIPVSIDPITRASKVVSRARSHGVGLRLPDEPISADDAGDALVALVARAQASGVDAAQAARDAVRRLEQAVSDAEAS